MGTRGTSPLAPKEKPIGTRTAILYLLATGCSPWVSVPPERAQPAELVVVEHAPDDAPIVQYRAWFPAGTAVEPTDPRGLAHTTARALADTLTSVLGNPEQGTHKVVLQVDLDWVLLGLDCAVAAETRCTDAWMNIVNLEALPSDVLGRGLSSAPDVTQPERSALDWLEALLFDGHRYGRELTLGCPQCRHDDVAQYYAATFRSKWSRWGVGGAFPPTSLDRIGRAVSEQERSIAPTLSRFSPATWKQTRVAILPSRGSERSIIAGNTTPRSWGDPPEGSSSNALPRRWTMVHRTTVIPSQTQVVEALKASLETMADGTPPHPSTSRDKLTDALVQSLPSRFPESILGPRSTEGSAWTLVLSSSTPDQDLEAIHAAVEQGILSPVDVWVVDVPPQAPEAPPQGDESTLTSSPSTTKPGASM